MGFLTPVLLAGSALIAVPVLLHLIMRRQPEQHMFPALRFVQQRRESNRRRMRLRHLLLLALRCALIAGFAFALARPTLKGSGLHGKEGSPLAVALVVDNSLRMEYVYENQTRLDRAVAMAVQLVGELPEDGAVAVLDRGHSLGSFVADANTAKSRLNHLTATSNPRLLEDVICEAIDLVAERQDYRQEVFLFSDLSKASLSDTALERIAEALAEAEDVRIYLIDAGVGVARNLSLGKLEMRSQVLTVGEPLKIDIGVQSTGLAVQTMVELFLNDDGGNPIKRGQQLVDLAQDANANVAFELAELPLGTHQGYVQLPASDPLAFDNIRYFTVEVRPPAKVLLVGTTRRDTLFVREALSPSLPDEHSQSRFRCERIRFQELAGTALDDYNAVGLLDPPKLSEEEWRMLGDFADTGGGVGIFLGHNASLSAFNEGAARRLLPGKLRRRSRDTTYFRPTQLDHPALSALGDYAADIPWQLFPVLQFWEFGELADDTHVIARFANNQPALFGRTSARSRVLTLATPFSDPLEPAGREPWNLLPTGPEPWPFVALCNQFFAFLSQDAEQRTCFQAGETVSIRLASQQQLTSFVVHRPDGEAIRQTLPSGQDSILISAAETLGNYQLAAGGQSRTLDRGFSINVAPSVSRLERVPPTEITEALPADRVRIAQTMDDMERYVDIGRSGRELFPWAIMLVAVIWSGEYLLSNRFYSN